MGDWPGASAEIVKLLVNLLMQVQQGTTEVRSQEYDEWFSRENPQVSQGERKWGVGLSQGVEPITTDRRVDLPIGRRRSEF